MTSAGSRSRVNICSAVSAKGALRFVKFLRRLLAEAETPIHLILDRHPVHRSVKVREFAQSTDGPLMLFFMPSYSPQLNPDERAWNYVKNHGTGRMSLGRSNQLKKGRSPPTALSAEIESQGAGFFCHLDTAYSTLAVG